MYVTNATALILLGVFGALLAGQACQLAFRFWQKAHTKQRTRLSSDRASALLAYVRQGHSKVASR